VGGGRTTPFLSANSRTYIGIDYCSAMVNACLKKFPSLQFFTLDASDLSFFKAEKFNVAVFSFNGVDYLSDTQRLMCLNEVNRVLKPDGLFIFSTHNARVIFLPPKLDSVNILRKLWRVLRSTKYLFLLLRQLFRKSFYQGKGSIVDPVHGSLLTHVSTPKYVSKELKEIGFELMEVVSSNYPVYSCDLITPWFYYVARKVQ
jgi:ubiquinone/menaquinone biosynthesis C-methylase UbiE